VQRAHRRGANLHEILALLEGGIVEKNLIHSQGGDRDSGGFLQQRPSQGWGPFIAGARGIRQDTDDFLTRAMGLRGRGLSSGKIAALVQRPAAQYAGRYAEHRGDAAALLRSLKGGGGGGGGGQRPNTPALLGAAGGSSIPQGSAGTLALLQALQGAQGGRQAVSGGGGLQAPSFSAAPPMPAGAQAVLSGGGPQPKQDIGALLEAVQQMGGGEVPAAGGQGGGKGAGGVPRAMGGGGGGSRLGKVSVAPGADRAGVSTRPHVVHFLERVAGIAGEGITVGTGSNHSQMTVNGNVSDHWSGRAADVPATGRDLIHLGRSALIAAGMSRAKARKISGGLFNLTWRGRRVQVIFNTHEGGDHTNHLHVGLSAPR
jgi:hypothetical protein